MMKFKIIVASAFLFAFVLAASSQPAFADNDKQPPQNPVQPVDSKGEPDLPGV